MTNAWQGVRERVEHLLDQAANHPDRVFGLSGATVLEPPLRDEQLCDLESQCGVRLPEAYRTFLVEVSAGGAGPFGDLFPVTRSDDGTWDWRGDGAEMTDRQHLSDPFDPRLTAEQEAVLERPEPDAVDSDEYELWMDDRDAVLWDESRTRGAICLCHEGCALRAWLVVSGPRAGQIWSDHRADEEDLAPVPRDGGDTADFADWYLAWLTQSEAAMRTK